MRFLVKNGPMPMYGIGWAHKGQIVTVNSVDELPNGWSRYGEVIADLTVPVPHGETVDETIGPFDQDLVEGDESASEEDAMADPQAEAEVKSLDAPSNKLARGGRKK